MSGGANERHTVGLLTFVFMVAAAVYVVLTFELRPPGFPLSPWEFVYVEGADAWPYYILWHPCCAILWGAFIAAAAVQFYRLREWGRAALELASWLVALLLIGVIAFVPLHLVRGGESIVALLAAPAIFVAASVLCVLCILIIRVLGSPKVRAAMIDRPRRRKPRSR
ncbi:MAG: hypothetical protein ACYTFZ_11295 [Planctomycetota bacterium]|jgi:hypothetical protein